MVEKLWGKQPSHGSLLVLCVRRRQRHRKHPDTRAQNPMLGGSPPYDKQTAVYDISAKTVYLPDGTKLEAHSGLGSKMDDARYSHVRMQGVTPPHIYELTPREALFHGVPALRLNPIGGEDKIFGRDGLLAHTYMLGGERRFQRLRFVQGLLRVPECLGTRASGGLRCWRGSSERVTSWPHSGMRHLAQATKSIIPTGGYRFRA